MNGSEDGSALVEIEDLEVKRGSFRLRVPRWKLRAGRVVGVVGANGAGKTTLLNQLVGIGPAPSQGRVRVFGLDPLRDPVAVRVRLGWATDDLPLWDLRVWDVIRRVSGYYPTWDAQLAARLTERLDVRTDVRVSKLSKGEGTRLRLLLAMAFEPTLLVLDEPGTGLDLTSRRALLREVLEIVGDPSRSVVISSHLLADVERVADRLLVMHKGTVLRQGTTDELVGAGRTLEEALLEWGAA